MPGHGGVDLRKSGALQMSVLWKPWGMTIFIAKFTTYLTLLPWSVINVVKYATYFLPLAWSINLCCNVWDELYDYHWLYRKTVINVPRFAANNSNFTQKAWNISQTSEKKIWFYDKSVKYVINFVSKIFWLQGRKIRWSRYDLSYIWASIVLVCARK